MPRPSPPPYAVVAFDCDSTLSSIEGIDELGRGVPGVAELTERAMAGEIPLEDVYGLRLDRIAPDRRAVEAVAERYVETLAPGARELVEGLTALGKRVAIVSGGLRPAILPLARALGLHERDVFAVDVRFDAEGRYAGFDEASPLARAGGKIEVLRALGQGAPLAFVGDGATDLEAKGETALFVAFAGFVRREAVVLGADAVVDVPDFAPLEALLLTPAESAQLRARGPLR